MKFLLAILALTSYLVAQPALPLAVGGQLEFQSEHNGSAAEAEIGRITPYVALWIPGLGQVKVGYSSVKTEYSDNGGVIEAEERRMSLQLGAHLGGLQRPYVFGNYSRVFHYRSTGDDVWNEWGLGLGGLLSPSPWSGMFAEIENRWVEKHRSPNAIEIKSANRIQLNIGLMFFFY
jgi:hypothetical protein